MPLSLQLSCSVWPLLFLSSSWLASIGDLLGMLCWHCSVSPLLAFLAFAVCVMDTRFIYTGWELQGRMKVPILRTIHGSVGITPWGVACCVKLIHWQMSRSSLCRKMIRKTDNDLSLVDFKPSHQRMMLLTFFILDHTSRRSSLLLMVTVWLLCM